MRLPLRLALLYLCGLVAMLSSSPAARSAAQDKAPSPLSLKMSLSKRQVYQGETVAVTVTLQATKLRLGTVGYPRLKQHAVEFVVTSQPVSNASEEISEYRFEGLLSPARPGRMVVGPAQMECEVIEPAAGGAAFFGGVAPRHLTVVAPPSVLEVLPLPQEGRPDSFSGALGSFALEVTSRPEPLVVGEPAAIHTSIRGDGNLAHAACPQFSGRVSRTYPPTVVRKPGLLECEQVIIPEEQGTSPQVDWSYFDPGRGQYRTERRTLPLAPRAETAPKGGVRQDLSRQARLMPLWVWPLMALPIAAVLGLLLHCRTKGPVHPPPRPGMDGSLERDHVQIELLEQALATGDVEGFYTLLFACLQRMVGSATGVAACSISAAPYGIAHVQRISSLFSRCELVRYGRVVPEIVEMQADLELVRSIITAIPTTARG